MSHLELLHSAKGGMTLQALRRLVSLAEKVAPDNAELQIDKYDVWRFTWDDVSDSRKAAKEMG